MTRLNVSPALSIEPDAIEETFILASGPGGQRVNKVCLLSRWHNIRNGAGRTQISRASERP